MLSAVLKINNRSSKKILGNPKLPSLSEIALFYGTYKSLLTVNKFQILKKDFVNLL